MSAIATCPCGQPLTKRKHGGTPRKYCSNKCQIAGMRVTSPWYLAHRGFVRSLVRSSNRELGCLVIWRD